MMLNFQHNGLSCQGGVRNTIVQARDICRTIRVRFGYSGQVLRRWVEHVFFSSKAIAHFI